MKYTIIGAGPCGLSLAYILSLNNINVDIIEQSNQFGGSWNSQWIEDKYFSENSPRVLINSGYTKLFLDSIGINNSDLDVVYGSVIGTNLKILKFMYKFFNFCDYFKFVYYIILYKIITSNYTVQDILDDSSLSKDCKKFITIFSILINAPPNQTNMNDFAGTLNLSTTGFQQFKEPNKWHEILEYKFKKMKNVNIYKNTKINKILLKNNKVHQIVSDDNKIFETDKVFLCTQSTGILNILENSDLRVKNNWFKFDYFKEWCKNTSYNGLSFQLHFDSIVDYTDDWCWSCNTDWFIIITPVSNWLKVISKDSKIKTVWSCTIVSQNVKSKNINKTANECNIDEFINESLFQINQKLKIPKPYKITVSENLKKIDNEWKSYNTGFTRGKYEYLPMKGNIKNLFALGSFTDTSYSHVSFMETSIRASIIYLNKYEKNMIGFHTEDNKFLNLIILIIIYIIIVYDY